MRTRTRGKKCFTSITLIIVLLLSTVLPSGMVPKVSAQISEGVVISQVYGAGGNGGALFNSDFIELYNPTDNDISLGGWSVQYASQSGTSWSVTPLAGEIKAHGYYLITEAGGANGAKTPDADASGSIPMAAANGKVALVKDSTDALSGAKPSGVVDFVGFGAATSYEGSGPTKAPSTTNSVHRISYSGMGYSQGLGNGWDTDDNASDFVAITAAPRNTASPIEIFMLNESIKPIAERIFYQQSGTDVTIIADEGTVSANAIVTFYETSTKEAGAIGTTVATDNGSFVAAFDATNAIPVMYVTATEADKPESKVAAVNVATATNPITQSGLSYNVDSKGVGTLIGTKAALAKARIFAYKNNEAKLEDRLIPSDNQSIIADASGNFEMKFNNAPETVYVTQQNYTATGIMLESSTVSITKPSSDEITKINTVREYDNNGKPLNLNKFYTIEGVVTIDNGILGTQKSNYYIQDETAGINIFGSFDHKLDIKRGDRVRVSGKVLIYNGLLEFEPTAVTKIAEGDPLPEPNYISVMDMNTFTKIEPLEGTLATISGKVTSAVVSGTGYNVTIADENAKTTLLRVMNATKINMEKDIVVNKSYTFTGIVSQYTTNVNPTNGYQLFPRDVKDIAPILGLTHVPLTEAYSDTNVSFEAFADGAQTVTLYYRNVGESSFISLPMSDDTQGRYTATLASTVFTKDSFEYYIEAIAGENVKTAGSKEVPYVVTLVADKVGPTFVAEIPVDTAKVESPRPEISVVMEDPSGVNNKSIEILVDNLDVTKDATVSNTQVKYIPTADLALGNHTVKVTASDTKGNKSTKEWTFEVVPRFTGGNHYRGTTHNHTNISHDAAGGPEDALKAAKKYNYDYFAFSDHSHDIDPELLGQDTVDRKGQPERTGGADWQQTKELAKKYTKDGEYVVFPAFELTSTTWGHSNVFGTENFIDRNINGKQYQDLSKYYAWVLTYDDVVAQFNHPDMSKDAFNNFKPYDKNLDKLFTMLEVGNGSGHYGYANAEGKLFSALDLGWHVAPTYGEDNHDGTWGQTNARTVIVAKDLSQESLLHSMANMRVYMTEDPSFQLDVLANGYYMGSTVDSKTLKFDIKGSDPIAESKATGYDYLSNTYKSDDNVTKVELISNGGKVVDSYSPKTKDFTWSPSYTVASGQQWFVVRVTQADGERAYSAPIWSKEETVDVKVNSIDIVGDVVIEGNPATAKVTVGNFGTQTVNNLTVDLFLDAQDDAHKLGSSVINSILAKGTGVATINWAKPVEGDHNLIAVVTSNDGANLGDVSFTLPIKVKKPLGIKVLIDAKHGNENSGGDTGTYKDNLKAFTLLLQKEGYTVEENKAVITTDVLKDVKILVITHPRTALTADEQKAVGDFVKAGGSVLFAGKSNNGSTDSTMHNATLEAIGTQIRMSHDGVFDDSKTGNFWGDPAVSPYAVRAHPGLVDNYLTDRVPFIDYYSGSSLQAVNNSALTEKGKVKILVKGNETTYQGNIKNGSYIYDNVSDTKGGSAIPLMASDEIGTGRILVSGMNTFNDKQMDESFEPKGNPQFILNAVNWLAHRETQVINIADARKLADDTSVVITGKVTTAAGVFFDAFYVQDETGGIMAFNEVPDGSLKLGDTVRIYGHIKTFENNKEIEFGKFDIDVIKTENGAAVAPKEVTTGTATSTVNQGLLVKVKGKVTSKYDDTSYIINDGSGNLLVFTDGYIEKQGIPVPQLNVGDTLEAVGLAGKFSGGSRIRVRDTKELIGTPGENVGDPVVELEVDKKSVEMTKGDTVQLHVKQITTTNDGKSSEKDVTNEATYTVGKANVATVTNGLVTAKTQGTTTITIIFEQKEVVVSVTVKNPSGGNQGNENQGNGSTPSSKVEDIQVDKDSGTSFPQTPIKRTTEPNGTVKDELTLTSDSVKETIEKLKELHADTAKIVIPDKEDKVSEVKVAVPKESVGTLANGKINLEISTDNMHLFIPQSSMQNFGADLFFRVVPVKEQAQKNEIEVRAKKEALVKQIVGNKKVNVLGRPMEIDTNMQNRSADITLPLPTNVTKEQMDNLAIYIEHSDGTKEIKQGKLVEFSKNTQGIQFNVTKFSSFTILYMEGAGKYFAQNSCGDSAKTSCLQVNKTTPLYILENNRLKKVGEAVKGQSLPVKQTISPMIGLGGDIWLERTAAITYETPSKEMLAKNQLPANKRPKQIWKGLELTPGQIGKVTILKDTVIWQSIDKTTKLPRILKKGEQYRVYRYVPGMYQVSDNQYIVQDSNVKLINKK